MRVVERVELVKHVLPGVVRVPIRSPEIVPKRQPMQEERRVETKVILTLGMRGVNVGITARQVAVVSALSIAVLLGILAKAWGKEVEDRNGFVNDISILVLELKASVPVQHVLHEVWV